MLACVRSTFTAFEVALALNYSKRGYESSRSLLSKSRFDTQTGPHMLQQQQQEQEQQQQQQQQRQQQNAVHTRSLGEEDKKAINYRKMQAQVKTKLGSISTRMPSKAIKLGLRRDLTLFRLLRLQAFDETKSLCESSSGQIRNSLKELCIHSSLQAHRSENHRIFCKRCVRWVDAAHGNSSHPINDHVIVSCFRRLVLFNIPTYKLKGTWRIERWFKRKERSKLTKLKQTMHLHS
uniref:Uncharacterized protein n=1 Tax=Glossina palpalis gambiensis TaxID=67801 RepID=A0A1B0ARI2_9MUSC